MVGLVEWMVVGCSVVGITALILGQIVARKERKAWRQRMEEIEKKYTSALCASGAQFARSRMRTRWVIRTLEKMLGITE